MYHPRIDTLQYFTMTLWFYDGLFSRHLIASSWWRCALRHPSYDFPGIPDGFPAWKSQQVSDGSNIYNWQQNTCILNPTKDCHI